MAEPGKGKEGGGDASKGKQPVAAIPQPELTPNTPVGRQALLSIANLHHSNNPVSNAGIQNSHLLLPDTFLVPVRNPVPFWTVCNGCKSLVKCKMICWTTDAICPHNNFTRLNSEKADLPDFYRAINAFIFRCWSLAGRGPRGSANSSSSNCPPFSNAGETPDRIGPLPSLQERYDRAVADRKYFYQTLICVTNSEGRNLQIPTIGGNQLNLHKIFVEVTARGGIQKVMEEDRLKAVCASLPQKIDEDYLFATYMALLDSYEYIFLRIPDEIENHIFGSLPLDSCLRPMQKAAGTGESSMQVQDNVPIYGNWAQGSSSAKLVPNKGLSQQASASRAQYTAPQQPNVTPYVPSPSSSAQLVSLQREAEVRAASVQREEANFFVTPDWWSSYAIPGSAGHLFELSPDPQWNPAAIEPYEPSSSATQVSDLTFSQTMQTLPGATGMQTTDSWPTEYPAYGPLLHERMITPAESTGIRNLSSTPSSDNITLGEQEAFSERHSTES